MREAARDDVSGVGRAAGARREERARPLHELQPPFLPDDHQARALIASGALGDVWNVHGGYLQDWLLYPTDWNWRLEPEKGGALRAVADIGSHWMDLAQWVTGRRIESVFADLTTTLPVRQRPTGEVETFAAAEDMERVDAEMTTEDIAHLCFGWRAAAWAPPSCHR